MSLDLIGRNRMFGGWQQRYGHFAASTNCTMTFSIFYRHRWNRAPGSGSLLVVGVDLYR